VQEISAALKAVSEGLMVGTRSHLSALFYQGSVTPRLTGLFAEDDAPIETLTPRESEVLQLLARGLPNKQIAYQLKISEHTVKFHISSVYSKLGAANRTEAVRAGARHGLIVL
jgi:DNA-binding NarL/FixJ family response regulator